MSTPTGKGSREEQLIEELDHLYRFAGAVGSNLDVETLIEDAQPALLSMGQAERILVALIANANAKKVTVHFKGFEALQKLELAPQVVLDCEAFAVGYQNTSDLPAPFSAILSGYSSQWAVVPLTAYGRQLGLLVLGRPDEPYSASTLKLLNTAGRQLALAVENSRLFGDLQRSYRQLMDAQEELIRSERLAALGGLAATMAHEIRNPLATIFSSLSQIRKHTQMSGDSATLLEIAEEEALRLNRMVAGLLEFARPRTPRFEDVRPMDIITEVVDATSSNPEYSDELQITVTPDPGTADIVAQLDPELFRQTIHHVLNNAMAALESGPGQVSLELEVREDPPKGISVTVRDDGCGISPEVRNNIFEPFFSTKPSGIGLGLPVVKRIAEDHDGSVEIDSTPGSGTEVRLFFGEAAPSGAASLDKIK